jgi:hypothetical protein
MPLADSGGYRNFTILTEILRIYFAELHRSYRTLRPFTCMCVGVRISKVQAHVEDHEGD